MEPASETLRIAAKTKQESLLQVDTTQFHPYFNSLMSKCKGRSKKKVNTFINWQIKQGPQIIVTAQNDNAEIAGKMGFKQKRRLNLVRYNGKCLQRKQEISGSSSGPGNFFLKFKKIYTYSWL